jgi:hypothetical protein
MQRFKLGTITFAAIVVLASSMAEAQWETSAAPAPQGAAPAAEPAGGGADEGPLLGAPAGASVAGFLGYGVDLEEGGFNPFGFTLGARGGYTFEVPVYVGGTVAFMLGEKEGPNSWRMLQLGVEVGYDFAFGPVVVRPFLGFGLNGAFFKGVDFDGDTVRESTGDFYLAGGATALYFVNETFFVGGEIRGTSVFVGGPENLGAMSFLATAGAHF